MTFQTICLLGILTSLPFGAAFLLMPDATPAMYEISGWNPGTTTIARLFGVELLYMTGALIAVRGTTDPAVQRRFATMFCLGSLVATVLLVQAAVSGAVGPMMWSSVALYGFFAIAWGWIARRRAAD